MPRNHVFPAKASHDYNLRIPPEVCYIREVTRTTSSAWQWCNLKKSHEIRFLKTKSGMGIKSINQTFNLAWVHVALWGSGGRWAEVKLLPRRTTEAKSSGPPERRLRSERLRHSRTAKPHPLSLINPVPALTTISLPWKIWLENASKIFRNWKENKERKRNWWSTFILTRSRNWIQQLAMEAPVLRSKSDGAELRRTPMSNSAQSEEPGTSRATVDSWPESFRPSS